MKSFKDYLIENRVQEVENSFRSLKDITSKVKSDKSDGNINIFFRSIETIEDLFRDSSFRLPKLSDGQRKEFKSIMRQARARLNILLKDESLKGNRNMFTWDARQRKNMSFANSILKKELR